MELFDQKISVLHSGKLVISLFAKKNGLSKVCSQDKRFLKVQKTTRNIVDGRLRVSSHIAFPIITLN